MIRGLIWHTEGARLIPRHSPESMRAVNNKFPSWSWASVGYELVRNHQKSSNHFQALSKVENVQINLLDQYQPFGAVENGTVILTGPLKRLPRLYNSAWKSVDVSMSELERHLSEIVEMESPRGVKPRYSSPPGEHFAALQMLTDLHSLDLLVLEATGEVSTGISVYRRVGILTLRHFHKRDIASPELIALRQKTKASLSVRLGPRHKGSRRYKHSNKVVEELRREPWKVEFVIII